MPIPAGGWSVRLPDRVQSAVNEIAEIEDRRPSEVARRLIVEAIEARKAKNPSHALSGQGGPA
jgi:predicted transcriptional regulator